MRKSPYVYQFKKCEHKSTERQSTVLWRGWVCTACNTIVSADSARRWE